MIEMLWLKMVPVPYMHTRQHFLSIEHASKTSLAGMVKSCVSSHKEELKNLLSDKG